MRIVAAFDFDGTITKKDTFLEFIKYVKGDRAFYVGFFLYSPFLLAYKLGLFPNWKVKQMIFSYFFRGMKYQTFKQYGENFSERIDSFVNAELLSTIRWHKEQGHDIYVVSASIEEWVRPWCETYGLKNVLCTQIAVDEDNSILGTFLSNNCYGQEKVNRLLLKEPNRTNYYLYAYGDSDGDKEMLEFANKGILIDK